MGLHGVLSLKKFYLFLDTQLFCFSLSHARNTYTTISAGGSAAVVKHHDQRNLGNKGFVLLVLPHQSSIIKGSHGRNSSRNLAAGASTGHRGTLLLVCSPWFAQSPFLYSLTTCLKLASPPVDLSLPHQSALLLKTRLSLFHAFWSYLLHAPPHISSQIYTCLPTPLYQPLQTSCPVFPFLRGPLVPICALILMGMGTCATRGQTLKAKGFPSFQKPSIVSSISAKSGGYWAPLPSMLD